VSEQNGRLYLDNEVIGEATSNIDWAHDILSSTTYGQNIVSGLIGKSNFFEDIELCPVCHGSDVRETKDGKFCNQLCKKLIKQTNIYEPYIGGVSISGTFDGWIASSSVNNEPLAFTSGYMTAYRNGEWTPIVTRSGE
jgi:hypothetical protein